MISSTSLDSKERFFKCIFDLDDLEADVERDVEVVKSTNLLKRKRDADLHVDDEVVVITKQRSFAHETIKQKSEARALEVSELPRKVPRLTRSSTTLEGHKSDRVNQKILQRSQSDIIVKAPRVTGKLFDDLHFFFFPNNDIHPGRKFRIKKATDYGATWTKTWSETVTHLIVDRSMNYDQVMSFLHLSSLPPHVHIVDESYPADCIAYRNIIDARQKQYRVKGYKADMDKKVEVAVQETKTKPQSLELKPYTNKAVIIQTPSQHTEPSQIIDTSPLKNVVTEAGEESRGGMEKEQDVLDEAIEQAKQQQDLLLDEDSDDHGAENVASNITISGPKWQEKFQCMKKHTVDDNDGPNAATIALLQEMADYYNQIRDTWRPIAYRKAIAVLRQHPTKVCTKEEAQNLPCVGERLAAKIEEIVYTNHLRRLESAKADPSDRILQLFLKIYGVGFSEGMKLISRGYKSLSDLKSVADKELTTNQKIGLEHYNDFNSRIPRSEVKLHSDIVASAAKIINKDVQIYTMGSYRRRADTSGDIDLIVTHPDWSPTKIREMVLQKLIPRLFDDGFLKCALATTSKAEGSKWHGASCLPSKGSEKKNPWRRIDFLLVPADQIGAALIYFTGNDIFNRSLRLLASKKGMRLNQRGLYKDVMRGRGREKVTEGELVEGRSERKIFEILGVPWREPWERIC